MNELRLDHSERRMRRRLAALAFLDVVGYARMVAVNEERTLQDWRMLRRTVIEPRIMTWRGRVIDRAGDGIFAEFGSALEALNWAIDVQTAAGCYPHPGEPIILRIAVHLADVIDSPDGEVQGDGVNTASRLQNYADAGGIVISQAVMDAVRGKTEAVFSDLGLLQLKNLAYPIRAFRLHIVSRSEVFPKLPRRAGLALGMVTVLVGLVGALYWQTPRQEQAERLLQQGLAIKCPSFPCGRQWLEQKALFEQAISIDPALARGYAEAALVYARLVSADLSSDKKEDLRTGARLATQAVALAPDEAFSHFARAGVLRHDPDRLEEALSAYLRGLSMKPGDTIANANVGWLLLLLGRPVEAESYLQVALKAEPQNISVPAWLNRMGLAELFLGQYESGADFFRRSIAQQSETDARGDVGLEREINLAAALALDDKVHTAQEVIEHVRLRHPTLSAGNIWSCKCSSNPAFKAGMAKLRKGAALAGVANID